MLSVLPILVISTSLTFLTKLQLSSLSEFSTDKLAKTVLQSKKDQLQSAMGKTKMGQQNASDKVEQAAATEQCSVVEDINVQIQRIAEAANNAAELAKLNNVSAEAIAAEGKNLLQQMAQFKV